MGGGGGGGPRHRRTGFKILGRLKLFCPKYSFLSDYPKNANFFPNLPNFQFCLGEWVVGWGLGGKKMDSVPRLPAILIPLHANSTKMW